MRTPNRKTTPTWRGLVVVGSLIASTLMPFSLGSASAVEPSATTTPEATVSPTPTPTSSDVVTPAATPAPSSTPAPGATPAGEEMVTGLIVKYRDPASGIRSVGPNAIPIGAELVTSADITTASPLAEGLTTLKLAQPVDVADAEAAAAEIEKDPRVEWAEPDRIRRTIVDSVRPLSSTVDITVSGIDGSATRANAFTYNASAPTVTSLSVAAGPIAGGTSVVLTGTNLSTVSSLTVGGTAATRGTTTSTSIAFTTPAKSAGTYSVVVTTPSGYATLTDAFTYVAAPIVSTVDPVAGQALVSGQTVTLTGANLSLTSSVTFGGTLGTITSVSATSVEVMAPLKTAGAVNVVLVTPGGTVTKTSAFTYAAAPTITSLSVTSGGTAGGTSVTLTGTNLAFVTSVAFGGSVASIVSKTPTSVVVTTPTKVAGVVTVDVTAPNGTVSRANAFTYVGSPSAASLNKTEGPLAGKIQVTLSGTNLTGVKSVTVGGTAATSVSSTATTVRFTAPAKAAGSYNVVVTSPFGSSTLTNAFTYLPVPTVSSFSQALGSSTGGQSVVLTGTALGSASTVTFGGSSATITARTNSSLTVTTPVKPASSTAVNVVVTTPGGAVTKTSAFTFAAPPTLTTVSPSSTSGTGGGSTLTVAGTNLLPITGVAVDGVPATISSKTVTSLTIVTPVHATGTVGITVTGDTGSASKAGAITYVLRAPTVASMTPSTGSVDGGSTVVISGSNFGDATQATFGGVAATILAQTVTTLTVRTPAKLAGSANLVVTGPGGSSTEVRPYTFVAPAPSITSVTPNAGRLTGGNVVTITGTRLSGVTAVKFGTSVSTALSGTSLTVVSDTELRVTTPVGTSGSKSVFAITPSGTATKTSGFTYVAAPTITTVSPATGSRLGGSTVSISGRNLSGAVSVTIGANAATVITNTSSKITAIVPAGSAGAQAIVIVTPGGTVTKSAGFTYSSATNSQKPNKANKANKANTPTPLPTSAILDVTPTPSPVQSQASMPTPSASTSTSTSPASVGSVSVNAVSPKATDCVSSTADHPVQRCFDDNDLDAGRSINGEIIYADAFVESAEKSLLVMDVVPYWPISSDSWLSLGDTEVQVLFDTNGDQSTDLAIVAPNANLTAGSSVDAGVFDHTSGSWVYRGALCSATLTRISGTHFGVPAVANNQWWQFSVDWACLFGSASSDVDFAAYMTDNLNDANSDYAPNSWSGESMNLTGLMQDPPTITSLSPSSGGAAGGTSVTISGTNMSDVSIVNIGGTSGTITSRTATQVVVTTPRVLSTGAVDVTVIGPGGSDLVAGGFTYVSSAPTITSVTPSSGPASGGTSVTIAGTNLGNVSNVLFGSASGTIVSQTATSIVVTSPAEGSGFVPTVPTETAYTNGTLWGLKGSFGTKTNTAWNLTQGSSDIVVAVLDTGITAHPDLGAQVPGYDMIASTGISNDGNGRDADPSDPGDWCPSDGSSSSWHGTHVAGTVNASINGVGSVGVAPNVKVQPVRVLGTCGGSMSDIAAAIIWAAGGTVSGVPANPNPADVISLSLGGRGACSSTEQNAIDFAYNRGVIVTIAAGNENLDSSTSSPGNCNHVITVAATDSSGKRASFSNFGSYIEISAPGVGIYSTVNTGSTTPSGYSYESWNGTSMATPHVAGVVALMLSREPTLTPDQVLQRIQSTATAFGGGRCDSDVAKTCGPGIINAGLAVH